LDRRSEREKLTHMRGYYKQEVERNVAAVCGFIHTAQDKAHWLAVVSKLMNCLVLQSVGTKGRRLIGRFIVVS
jgi:hypothetical protein